MTQKPQRFVSDFTVPLELARAWEVFSNTDHFNRFVPLPPVQWRASPDHDSKVLRQALTHMYGLRVKWTEYPFEWVEEQHFAVRRLYDGGLVAMFVIGMEFTAAGGDTKLRLVAELTPRFAAVRPFLGLMASYGMRAVRAYIAACVEQHATNDLSILPRRYGSQADGAKLYAYMGKLVAQFDVRQDLCEKLRAHLRAAGDDEVLRMRPFVLADAWGEDRHETLELFLYATKSGILTLDWELMCPNCRVPKAEASSFKAIPASFHCDLCGINYEADMDRYTELRFSVSKEIREAEDAIYCIGSPAKTPHVIAQHYLLPGQGARFTARLPDAELRMRVVGPNDGLELKPQEKSGGLELAYDGSRWLGSEAFAPGPVDVIVRNTGKTPCLAVIEKTRWDDRAVTAALVSMMQKFRDLFSSEVLAPGQQIGIRNLCVLFIDLKRSTELYEQVGDASAFSRVNRLFDFVREHVTAKRGGIVKTIGDAVMAVFPAPLAALDAACQMQLKLASFNRERNFEPPFVLKMGINVGPAIAVNANGVLDYFGRTVNLAARIQSESRGGDVVLGETVFESAEVRAFLASQGIGAAPYKARLKGFEEEIRLIRLQFDERSKSAAA